MVLTILLSIMQAFFTFAQDPDRSYITQNQTEFEILNNNIKNISNSNKDIEILATNNKDNDKDKTKITDSINIRKSGIKKDTVINKSKTETIFNFTTKNTKRKRRWIRSR